MSTKSGSSLSNSLKGKIRLSAMVPVFLICVFGSLSYAVVSFLTNDPLYAILIPFALSAFVTAAFGFWLSNEISAPVEQVLLLTKSMERGTSTALPKTSGAAETDEILQIAYRISEQVKRLVKSMDDLVLGNWEAVSAQNKGTDRISISFQKLLGKVSESINAGTELEKLQTVLRHLSAEVEVIKEKNLLMPVGESSNSTKEVTAALNYLVEHLSDIVSQAKTSSGESYNASHIIKKSLNKIIGEREAGAQEMSRAAENLKKVPQIAQKISEEFSQSAQAATGSIEKLHLESQKTQENLNAVRLLRSRVQESVKHVRKLGEMSREIETVAKIVGDLARRTNLVAMNTSLQVGELGEQGKGFAVVSEEIERLSNRAEKTNKHINTLNQSIRAEIGKVENSLENAAGEISEFSKFTIETAGVINDIERNLTQYLKLQERIAAYAEEQAAASGKAFDIFTDSAAETEELIKELKDSGQAAEQIIYAAESLQSAVAKFSPIAEKPGEESDSGEPAHSESNIAPQISA